MGLSPENWQALSNPKIIAIVGASDRAGTVNFTERFLTRAKYFGYSGRILFVNPRRETVFGERCWPDLAEVAETPDAVAIRLPSSKVLDVVKAAIDRGV